MDKMLIRGGKPLHGEVYISGSKNAVLPLMAATLLTKGVSCLRNVPLLQDVRTMARLLEKLGAKVELNKDDKTCTIDTTSINSTEAPYELVKTMRSSVLVLGPLAARYGEARVSLPGGCAIGSRPVNFHVDGMKAIGFSVGMDQGYINAKRADYEGGNYTFPVKSVTGTENIVMAAALSKGETVLDNCAKEPHVIDLVNALKKMGAKIEGVGSDKIVVTGVEELSAIDYEVQPDYIEAGTFLMAAAISRGDVTIHNFPFQHLHEVIHAVHEMGVHAENLGEDKCRVRVFGELYGTDVVTGPYPAFPTDMQAQILALMAISRGISVITENIFENRFMHVSELERMGANIRKEGKSVIIKGVRHLSGAQIMATDLRASASLVIAGLAGSGVTEVQRIYHLDRGYENIESKLADLNASVARVDQSVDRLSYWEM